MENKDVKYYMELPYNYMIQHVSDESGSYYYGNILELDGCHSTGDTFEDTYDSLREAMEGYLEVRLAYNDPIPEPLLEDDYSGKFVVRIPKSLHKKLSIEAAKEGVSLNQYAVYKLSK